MLRNRTKQALMADQTNVSSPYPVPKFINGYFSEQPPKIEIMTPSPTSILDTQQFCAKYFGYDHKIISRNPNIFPHNCEMENPKRLGLALIHTLDEKPESDSRKVFFGSNLKIEIPKIEPKSPGDFGMKTQKSPIEKSNYDYPKVFDISTTEIELSEEYTRIIAHGASPRTIHIYDDCVLESCNGVLGLSELQKQLSLPTKVRSISGLENFLSFCSTCKKRLDHGKDIYIYRGEKGFCSHECRFKEMLSDGEDDLK